MKPLKPLIVVAAMLGSSMAAAQEYPKKDIVLVVPNAPGGGQDLIARFISNGLEKLWGQTVLVENRAGGGTSVGTSYVARSKPDGYTLLLSSSSYETNAGLGGQPFDPLHDLSPVAIVAGSSSLVITKPQLGVKNIKELKDKAKSDQLFYGHSGVGGGSHLRGELLNNALELRMKPVAYVNSSEMLLDLSAGRVDVIAVATSGGLTSIKNGAVPIVAMSTERDADFPDVETVVEAGYPGVVAENYWTLFAPSATPENVMDKLHEGVLQVMNSAEGKSMLEKMSAFPVQASRGEAQTMIHESIASWTALTKALGIHKDR